MAFYLNDFKHHLTDLAEKSKQEGVADYTEPVRPWQNTVSLTEAYRGMGGGRNLQQLNELSPWNPPPIKNDPRGTSANQFGRGGGKPRLRTSGYPDYRGGIPQRFGTSSKLPPQPPPPVPEPDPIGHPGGRLGLRSGGPKPPVIGPPMRGPKYPNYGQAAPRRGGKNMMTRESEPQMAPPLTWKPPARGPILTQAPKGPRMGPPLRRPKPPVPGPTTQASRHHPMGPYKPAHEPGPGRPRRPKSGFGRGG